MSDRLPRSLLLPELPRPLVVGHVSDQPISIEYVRKLTDALKANHTQVAERVEELIEVGDNADLPDASGAGRFFFEQDTDKLKFDDGTWNLVGGTGGFLPLSGGTMTGDIYCIYTNPYFVLSDTDQPSTAYNTVLQDRYDDAAGSSGFLWKKCLLGIPTLHLDAIATDGSSIGVIKMFRSCDTTGVGTHLTIYNATNSETPQHTFLAKSDANLCQQAGTLNIGDATDGVRIDRDGVYLKGTATMWDDLRFPAVSLRAGSATPSWSTFKDGTNAWHFSKVSDNEVEFAVQLPHAWLEGSDIEPHVHWCPSDTDTGDVTWKLEYTWANIFDTFGATTTIAVTDAADGTAYKHQLADFAAISGTGKTMSSMLICRLFRDVSDADDYDNDAILLEIDFHIQIDSFGSKEEYVKGP